MVCATALFWGRPPGAQGRVQRSTIIFEKSISKIFILNFMFVLKNKRMRFSLCRLSRTPGVGLGVAWGQFFPKHGRVAYQIEGDDEQKGIQVKFSPYGQTCDREV